MTLPQQQQQQEHQPRTNGGNAIVLHLHCDLHSRFGFAFPFAFAFALALAFVFAFAFAFAYRSRDGSRTLPIEPGFQQVVCFRWSCCTWAAGQTAVTVAPGTGMHSTLIRLLLLPSGRTHATAFVTTRTPFEQKENNSNHIESGRDISQMHTSQVHNSNAMHKPEVHS